MKIQVDKEGAKAIEQLCDIALRQSGLQNLTPVNQILQSTKLLENEEDEEQNEDD